MQSLVPYGEMVFVEVFACGYDGYYPLFPKKIGLLQTSCHRDYKRIEGGIVG